MKARQYRTAFALPAGPVNHNRRVKKRLPQPLGWALTLTACSLMVWGYVEYVVSLPKPESASPGAYWSPKEIVEAPSAPAPSFP